MFAGFFFMIFLILLFIIIIGGTIIRGILGLLFGRNPFRQTYGSPHGQYRRTEQSQQQTSQSQSKSQQTTATDSKKREKIFDKPDGEYVDFEEIK